MKLGRENLDWSKETWEQIDKATHDEAHRVRITMNYISMHMTTADELSFFFQAEDGIRDVAVTGVQTCALPIWRSRSGFREPASACCGGETAPGRSPACARALYRPSRLYPRRRGKPLSNSACAA